MPKPLHKSADIITPNPLQKSMDSKMLKKKIALVLGLLVLLFIIILGYYIYSEKKAEAPAPTENISVENTTEQNIRVQITYDSLSQLLETYEITVINLTANDSISMPSRYEIDRTISLNVLNVACLRTGFDLRRFENTELKVSTYLTSERDAFKKPVYLSVLSVNETIACAYKFVEDQPDSMYGLSQILETE